MSDFEDNDFDEQSMAWVWPAREMRFVVKNPWGYGKGAFIDHEPSDAETFRFSFRVEAGAHESFSGEVYEGYSGGNIAPQEGKCVACVPYDATAEDVIALLAEWYGNADDIYEVSF